MAAKWIKCLPAFPAQFIFEHITNTSKRNYPTGIGILVRGEVNQRGSWVYDDVGNPYPYRKDLWSIDRQTGKLIWKGY